MTKLNRHAQRSQRQTALFWNPKKSVMNRQNAHMMTGNAESKLKSTAFVTEKQSKRKKFQVKYAGKGTCVAKDEKVNQTVLILARESAKNYLLVYI